MIRASDLLEALHQVGDEFDDEASEPKTQAPIVRIPLVVVSRALNRVVEVAAQKALART